MTSNLKNEKNGGGKYRKEAMFQFLSKSDNIYAHLSTKKTIFIKNVSLIYTPLIN